MIDSSPSPIHKLHIVDSHTGGEPTRVVLNGLPNLGLCDIEAKRDLLRDRHDRYRSAVVNEPRGADVLVGAYLFEPEDPACTAGVVFINNVGYLGMCGHGTIGLLATLSHLGRIRPGLHKIETPVGVVEARLHEDGDVSVRNVPSYRFAKDVSVHVPGLGHIAGDVAYGGNWFFLITDHGQKLSPCNLAALTSVTCQIRDALHAAHITGKDGAEIDHVELFGPSEVADSRSFVLCPGSAYDRSPCGTGTSAKLACLFADGKLAAGSVWRQESIIGSIFEGSVEPAGTCVIPTIRGRAYVTGEGTLLIDEADPYAWGIGSHG